MKLAGIDNIAPPSAEEKAGTPCTEAEELFALTNSLAHEIRNPLQALALHLALLTTEVPDGKGRTALTAAQSEVRRLDELLTAFLRFARPKNPVLANVNLAHTLRELKTFIGPQANAKGVEITLDIPDDLAAVTDSHLLKQAVLNLILNSLETGTKRVVVDAIAGRDTVGIRVRDDGPGFADPARALEPFYSTKPDGTGLGLPTAHRIAASLGGGICLGNLAAGAEVIINIPRRPN